MVRVPSAPRGASTWSQPDGPRRLHLVRQSLRWQRRNRVRDALAMRGRAVFLDRREIEWGDAFPHEIARGIGQARLAVVFADETYFERPWCAFEFAVIVAPGPGGRFGRPSRPRRRRASAGRRRGPDNRPPAPAPRPAVVAESERDRRHRRDSRGKTRDPGRPTSPRGSRACWTMLAQLFAGGQVPTAKPPSQPATGAAPTRGSRSRHVPESRHDGFIGRERDLWRVFEALVTQRAFGAPRWCAIEGPGGATGKSQLAAELVWRYADRWFPGGVVWIVEGDAGDEAVVEQFREVLASYAPDAIDPSQHVSKPEEQLALLAGALREVLAQHAAGARTLWVIDNVPEAGPARPGREIDCLCPARGAVDVLCTSRRTGLQPIDAHVPLTWLPTQMALELLTRPPVDPAWLSAEEWREVLDWVGGLALALQVVRASLADGFTTAKALVQATRDEPAASLDSAMDAMRGEVDERELRSIADVFEFSYRAGGSPDCRHAATCSRSSRLARCGKHSSRNSCPRLWSAGCPNAAGSGPPLAPNASGRCTASQRASCAGAAPTPTASSARSSSGFRRLVAAPETTPHLRELGWLARGTFVAFAKRARGKSHQLPLNGRGHSGARDTELERRIPGTSLRRRRFGQRHGAADDSVRRFEQVYETGDEAIARALPNALQPLTASASAAALMARILDDPRDGPRRWQALIHASSLPSVDLGEKLLTAILRETNDNVRDTAITAFDVFLDARNPGLASLMSRLCERLSAGRDVELVRSRRGCSGACWSCTAIDCRPADSRAPSSSVRWSTGRCRSRSRGRGGVRACGRYAVPDATAHDAIVRARREATFQTGASVRRSSWSNTSMRCPHRRRRGCTWSSESRASKSPAIPSPITEALAERRVRPAHRGGGSGR